LGIIIAKFVWIICFFAEVVEDTEQEEAVSPFKTISVKDVRAMRAIVHSN
jgi:hypothetical protein